MVRRRVTELFEDAAEKSAGVWASVGGFKGGGCKSGFKHVYELHRLGVVHIRTPADGILWCLVGSFHATLRSGPGTS